MSDFTDAVLKTVDQGLQPDPRLISIGCVMTNQSRKDWGLAAAICGSLKEHLPNIHFWWHVDTQLRHWSIPALIADFHLEGHVEVTTPPMDDLTMAAHYRVCDLTILPSLGEGFGYPLVESIACGVPVVHVNYAGGASLLHTCGLERYLIEPDTYRLDTQHNQFRPVTGGWAWVTRAVEILKEREGPIDPISHKVDHLKWMNLAHPWRKWLREGLGE